MSRFRSFLSDLALIPDMWRHLVGQVRARRDYLAQVAAFDRGETVLVECGYSRVPVSRDMSRGGQ